MMSINSNDRYSKEDFLTVSSDYNKEKESINSKYRKIIRPCYILAGITGGLMIFSPVIFFNNLLLASTICLISMFLMVILGFIGFLFSTKQKKILENLGDKHYRNYIDKINKEKDGF